MHPHGIHTIDTGFVRPHFDAAYLVVENGRGAFIDCGTNHSVPRMLAELDNAGLQPEHVEWLILTHVHLDHAGGAGELMEKLPNARLVAHPRGARHMIDPSMLWAGASAVYGEETMEREYGRLRPVAADRVIESADGYVVDLRGRPLLCVETPGHAKHHQAIYDERARVCFTGDTFGLSYRELDTAQGAFGVPTTTPTQFDPEQLIASIDRLMATGAQAAYLMHYSRVTGLPAIAASLKAQIGQFAAMTLRHAAAADPYAAIYADMRALWIDLARAHGLAEPEARVDEYLSKDLDLNTQGLLAWLQRQRR